MNILTIRIDNDISKKHTIVYFNDDSASYQTIDTIDELELYRQIRKAIAVRMNNEHQRIQEMLNKKG